MSNTKLKSSVKSSVSSLAKKSIASAAAGAAALALAFAASSDLRTEAEQTLRDNGIEIIQRDEAYARKVADATKDIKFDGDEVISKVQESKQDEIKAKDTERRAQEELKQAPPQAVKEEISKIDGPIKEEIKDENQLQEKEDSQDVDRAEAIAEKELEEEMLRRQTGSSENEETADSSDESEANKADAKKEIVQVKAPTPSRPKRESVQPSTSQLTASQASTSDVKKPTYAKSIAKTSSLGRWSGLASRAASQKEASEAKDKSTVTSVSSEQIADNLAKSTSTDPVKDFKSVVLLVNYNDKATGEIVSVKVNHPITMTSDHEGVVKVSKQLMIGLDESLRPTIENFIEGQNLPVEVVSLDEVPTDLGYDVDAEVFAELDVDYDSSKVINGIVGPIEEVENVDEKSSADLMAEALRQSQEEETSQHAEADQPQEEEQEITQIVGSADENDDTNDAEDESVNESVNESANDAETSNSEITGIEGKAEEAEAEAETEASDSEEVTDDSSQNKEVEDDKSEITEIVSEAEAENVNTDDKSEITQIVSEADDTSEVEETQATQSEDASTEEVKSEISGIAGPADEGTSQEETPEQSDTAEVSEQPNEQASSNSKSITWTVVAQEQSSKFNKVLKSEIIPVAGEVRNGKFVPAKINGLALDVDEVLKDYPELARQSNKSSDKITVDDQGNVTQVVKVKRLPKTITRRVRVVDESGKPIKEFTHSVEVKTGETKSFPVIDLFNELKPLGYRAEKDLDRETVTYRSESQDITIKARYQISTETTQGTKEIRYADDKGNEIAPRTKVPVTIETTRNALEGTKEVVVTELPHSAGSLNLEGYERMSDADTITDKYNVYVYKAVEKPVAETKPETKPATETKPETKPATEVKAQSGSVAEGVSNTDHPAEQQQKVEQPNVTKSSTSTETSSSKGSTAGESKANVTYRSYASLSKDEIYKASVEVAEELPEDTGDDYYKQFSTVDQLIDLKADTLSGGLSGLNSAAIAAQNAQPVVSVDVYNELDGIKAINARYNARMLSNINNFRAKLSLPPLSSITEDKYMALAWEHSIVSNRFLTHVKSSSKTELINSLRSKNVIGSYENLAPGWRIYADYGNELTPEAIADEWFKEVLTEREMLNSSNWADYGHLDNLIASSGRFVGGIAFDKIERNDQFEVSQYNFTIVDEIIK